eukprot:25137-Chlamydomonas_euryale.AAC.1
MAQVARVARGPRVWQRMSGSSEADEAVGQAQDLGSTVMWPSVQHRAFNKVRQWSSGYLNIRSSAQPASNQAVDHAYNQTFDRSRRAQPACTTSMYDHHMYDHHMDDQHAQPACTTST